MVFKSQIRIIGKLFDLFKQSQVFLQVKNESKFLNTSTISINLQWVGGSVVAMKNCYLKVKLFSKEFFSELGKDIFLATQPSDFCQVNSEFEIQFEFRKYHITSRYFNFVNHVVAGRIQENCHKNKALQLQAGTYVFNHNLHQFS